MATEKKIFWSTLVSIMLFGIALLVIEFVQRNSAVIKDEMQSSPPIVCIQRVKADVQPKHGVEIKLDSAVYTVSQDTLLNLTLTSFELDEKHDLTQQMISGAWLEWWWQDTPLGELPSKMDGVKKGHSSYGVSYTDGTAVSLPQSLQFSLREFRNYNQEVLPGYYEITLGIPISARISIRSLPIKFELKQDNKSFPKYELDATFDAKIYEIKPNAQIHVTLNAGTLGKKDLVLTKAMTDHANLEWAWTDKNDPNKSSPQGFITNRAGDNFYGKPIELPSRLTFSMESTFGKMLNLRKPRDPKLKADEKEPHVFDRAVLPGFYDVNLAIPTGRDVYRSEPTRIEVIANTQVPQTDLENEKKEDKKP